MTRGTRTGGPIPRLTAIVWVALVFLLLGGCIATPVKEPKPPSRAPVPLPDVAEPPPVEPVRAELPVAVVLSADTLHYRAVADALGKGDWQRYVLQGDGEALRAVLVSAGHRQAIAIGQQALELLRTTGLKVAYCQVFDTEGALRSGHTGVAPLPEFAAQLDAWLARQPELSHIGLITSDEYLDVAERLASAGSERAIVLRHTVVGSDRELLYVFRRMVPDINGFVLYPDTRVLSPMAIRELLDYARKHRVRVLTYNRAVYELGADLLISADPLEVAQQVVAVLEADATGLEAPLRRVVVEARDINLAGAP